MRQASVAKWRCQRRGDADEEQGEENLASWECRRYFLACRGREKKVEKARKRSKGGLNSVQDNREGKALRGRFRVCCTGRSDRIGNSGNGFLEDTP